MFSIEAFALIFGAFTVSSTFQGVEAADVMVDPESIKQFSTLPPASGVYDDWIDWESWDPSPVVAQTFRCYRSGYDLDGLVEFGKDDFRKLAAMPEEQIAEVWKGWEQWTRFMEKDAAVNNGQGIALIVDFDGFSLANYASEQALKIGLKVFSFLSRQHKAVKYGFFLNVNYAAESWINLARPFFGTFLDVFELCGTQSEKWKPLLFFKIPASQLSPKYGGTKDWKCLPVPRNRC